MQIMAFSTLISKQSSLQKVIMYSKLTNCAYLFRYGKWKKQTVLSFAMELYPSCGPATSAFSELLFHEAKRRPMRVPHFSPRCCHH